jgi:hypothetical protein
VGDVVVDSLEAGADEAGLVVVFFTSAAGTLALAAALAVVPDVAVDALTAGRVVFGGAGFVVSLGAAFGWVFAGDLDAAAAAVVLEAVGVFGRGDLGRGLRVELVPLAGDLETEMAAGFLVRLLPFVRGVSVAFSLLSSTTGAWGAGLLSVG